VQRAADGAAGHAGHNATGTRCGAAARHPHTRESVSSLHPR
jgi:hypothetical protein